METYQTIRQARIDALENKAGKLQEKSNYLANESTKMASIIPMGQPIHIGHHSEKSDRAYRAKIGDKMRKSIELDKQAEDCRSKLDAAKANRAINSKDSEAIRKLEEKIKGEEQAREYYKKANRIFSKIRKTVDFDDINIKTFEEHGATQKEAELMADALACQIRCYSQDYCKRTTKLYTYQGGYASAEIKRCRDRIDRLQKIDNALSQREDKETEVGKLVYNTELRGLELHFPDKPSEEIRTTIKQAGWKWSGRQKLWYAKATQKAEEAALVVLGNNHNQEGVN